ncbi:MAG TPA: hypothetical protein PLB01_10265 [Thermoanaerobaculia bacterium]|nr:hypothetical protein [Thermoanaerobaculia bacterium]
MPSWIPGYDLIEGPEETGIPFRYRAVREADGAAAWIRVDGFDSSSSRAAQTVDALYTATSRFDHPLLPNVLDFGSAAVTGRTYIAFQTSEPVAGGGHRTRRGTLTALAELQIVALECGFEGVHLPLHELLRLREGVRLEARHLPLNEFLCEPHRDDGRIALAGLEAEDEGAPFLAPESRSGSPGRSRRAALAYRLAAQIHVLLEGHPPGRSPVEDADKTVALSALPFPPRSSVETDVPRELVRLGLSPRPEDRPDLEHFLTVRLPSPKTA